MILKVFAIHDSKAKAFMHPLYQPTVGLGLRTFQNIAQDPQSQISKYPADFSLHEVAEYDDSTGVFKNLSNPVNLGLATQFETEA